MMPVAGAATASATAPERSGSACTDCSLCTQRTDSVGVRVSMDLSQFFSDRRASVLMWAPHTRCVQWLARRVAQMHGLPADVALMSRGHLLPAAEPLLLLDRDDPVQVVDMSYVFSVPDGHNDTPSERVAGETGIAAPPVWATTDHCNVIREQNGTGLPQVSGQRDTPDDCQSECEIGSAEDLQATTESSEKQSVAESEELQRLKRRALQLLDEHEAVGPKRLRRRRRRRRPPAASDDEPQPGASAAAAAAADADAASPERVVPPSEAASFDTGGVLRNGSGSRPPRLVRALSPSPLMQIEL